MSGGTGMSGRDPLLGTIFDWTVGAKGIDALGKTALWNFAKHVPTSELGKWGRNYFINNAFKQELRKPIQFGVEETFGKPTQYDIRDNITLYRANASTPKGRVGVKGDNSGEFIGKWFTSDPSKPNWYASNYMKRGESPTYYQVTVPKYWAEKQSAKFKVPERIEYEPEDYILEDGVNELVGQSYKGRPGQLSFLQQTFNNPEIKEPLTSLKFFERKPVNNLTSHVQGNEAVKMFKEYGGEPIPKGSINGEQLRKYVPEARERYGLVGNNNITDEEIAQALYKHSKELGGNTAAVNAQGEPQLLFRGDTHRYTQLKERMSPEELAKKSGTMDNSLGTLFLEDPAQTSRYLISASDFQGTPRISGSSTGAKGIINGETVGKYEGVTGKLIPEIPEEAIPLATYHPRFGDYTLYKLPGKYSETGISDLNAFVVRTPEVRNATSEISVLSDDFLSLQPQFKGKFKIDHPDAKTLEERQAMAEHYRYVLNDAEKKNQGLLKSDANSKFRDEHESSAYYTLPNFNIGGAKHLLPYDLRIPRNWKDRNIYRGLLPFLGLGTTSALYSKKQEGKLTINNTDI